MTTYLRSPTLNKLARIGSGVAVAAITLAAIGCQPDDVVQPRLVARARPALSASAGTVSEIQRVRIWPYEGVGYFLPYATRVRAINSLGQVTGSTSDGAGGSRVILWSPGDVTSHKVGAGTIGGNYSEGYALNDLGHIVGQGSTPESYYHAFFWSPATGYLDLGTFTNVPFTRSQANAVNGADVVVGNAQPDRTRFLFHAFIWTLGGGMRDLTPAATQSDALAINAAGQIAGSIDGRATIWQPTGEAVVFGPPGSSATSINDKGHVAGVSGGHAFLWTPETGMRDLGVLGTGTASSATAINGKDQIVGGSEFTPDSHVSHAFLWTPSDGMMDLYPVTGLVRADALNDELHVVGMDGNINIQLADLHYLSFTPGDMTPPAIVAAVAGTLGTNQWYTSDASLTWTVTDPESAVSSTSGCDASSVTSDTPGQSFTCSATSAGGTATQSVTIKVDKTAPVVAYAGNAGSYGVDQSVSITCSATDATSGVASTTCADISGAAYTFAIGTNAYQATATDNAGNSTTAATSFTVQVTPAGLANLTRQFVSDAGLAASLCAKLDAAAQANATARAGQLRAYANEVSAQSGKKISDVNAAILLKLVAAM